MESYIKVLIKEQQNQIRLNNEIKNIFENFDVFFNSIKSLIKRFDMINMLTRIELSRTEILNKMIGGSLKDVQKIPKLLKELSGKTFHDYQVIKDSFMKTISIFDSTFTKQEDMLNSVLKILNIVSQELNESRKYFHQITDDANNKFSTIEKFYQNFDERLENLNNNFLIIENMYEFFNSICDKKEEEAVFKDKERLKKIRDYFSEKGKDGEYKYMMMRSLLDEYIGENNVVNEENNDSVIFF